MTRLITDEQILAVYQVLQDVTGLVECNCSIGGCEGDCTYACAVAGIAILDALPVASQEAALKVATPLGVMEATVHEDPDYPGIVLSIGPTQVAVLEYNSSGPVVQLHCWDGAQEDAVAHIAVTVEEPVPPQEAATGPQEAQEAAAAPVPRYTVNLHVISLYDGERMHRLYRGDDETVMYSHVNAVEWTLAMTHGTAEIEIVEDGLERWIDYSDGRRSDFLREGK